MEKIFIRIGQRNFLLINGPLVSLSLIANIFFVYCLSFPPRNGQRLKQPLRILLGILVWSSIIYCVSFVIMYQILTQEEGRLVFTVWLVVLSFVHNSMTCSVWLNFFYYIQIVPSKRAPLIWIKKNIRSVIYMALFLGGMLFSCVGSAVDMILQYTKYSTTQRRPTLTNGTWFFRHNFLLINASQISYSITKLYILMCLCIMIVSSLSTHRFLQRHVRSLMQGGSSFSSPKIKSQMRVAITGICQGVLYFLFDTYNLLEFFNNLHFSHFYITKWVSFTVTSLYITGTTVNLGIGQAAFRLRLVDIWRSIKAQCVGVMVDNEEAHSVNTSRNN